MRRSVRALRRTSWRERALLAEAAGWLAAARLAVIVLPFRMLARRLGSDRIPGPPDLEGSREAGARATGWAVTAVAARVPWRCRCLEQGVAATMMLRRRGLPSTLYLGVARADGRRDGPILAHAWVRSGAVSVTGGADVSRYAVVGTFSDSGAPRG